MGNKGEAEATVTALQPDGNGKGTGKENCKEKAKEKVKKTGKVAKSGIKRKIGLAVRKLWRRFRR